MHILVVNAHIYGPSVGSPLALTGLNWEREKEEAGTGEVFSDAQFFILPNTRRKTSQWNLLQLLLRVTLSADVSKREKIAGRKGKLPPPPLFPITSVARDVKEHTIIILFSKSNAFFFDALICLVASYRRGGVCSGIHAMLLTWLLNTLSFWIHFMFRLTDAVNIICRLHFPIFFSLE